ncbi:hypothetical protein DFJ58DRAFT_862112 [Suillus subalutaceus]|uniref:uncharacterized protein n=1 Tax=Suillus subalutaceus TaxID=48586 RepID=UPI001B87096E|nr:uncharacterized protein DFJ58DRAFT_862112 [Suillus subalutaceus]KAG1837853.1 hypothetical protein DFJ58DRAFT_862112 [Suillus subalutaceus]
MSYWVAMSHALENQHDWHASHDWVYDRFDVVPTDGQELEIIDEVLDVLESLPWDAPLKGFGAQTDLRSTELRPLLGSCPIHGRVLDSMIAVVVQCMQASDDEDLQSISVESLDFADILRLSDKQWKSYKTDKAFIRLRTIGSALREGALHRILLPINIDNVHWAVIEVDATNQSISYADSLGWSWPNEDIDAIHHWLGYHGFAKFNRATTLQHSEQHDSFSCGIAALNTIKHALFQDPLFTDNRAFSLHMGEFLYIIYDHLELSDLNDDPNDSSYSDSDDVETQPPSPPTLPTHHPQQKPKLNLRATNADLSTGLFKFFPTVSRDEHLKLAWKPSTRELKDWDQQEQGLLPGKVQCRAREKDAKQKPTVESVLHDHTPQPLAVTIAEASCRKHKWEDTEARRVNWQSPLLWPTIETAAIRVGYGMSPIEIERKLKRVDPSRFHGISAQVIGRWIDQNGTWPVWLASVLTHVQKGNLPLTTATPPGILAKYPEVMKTIIEDLHALCAKSSRPLPRMAQNFNVLSLGSRNSYIKLSIGHFVVPLALHSTPSNADQLCLDQFYHLTLTIRDCAIFDASFYVNIDQTNIVYQPANTATYEEVGSKQVAVIGQEEKRAFTMVVGISASGDALPFQVIYCGKTARSLPSKSTPQFKDAQDLGFQLCFSNTDTYWSTFQLMCDYVRNILVPYWTRQKELIGAPDDQECILQLDVWSVHKSVQFRTWLDQQYPWIKYHFVPGGCTGIAQPCDVGVQCPFKLAESLSLLKKDEAAHVIRLDTTLPTLRDRSLQWLINGYHAINKPDVVKQCKAGTTFNLSFKSLTSHEALHALHDVQKNDTVTWECIKTAQYKTPEADKEVELPFTHAADVELDPSDVSVDTVLQHIALGESSVPHGYSTDDLGLQSTPDGSTEVEAEGRGKRRRVANTQYRDFWMH